MRRASIGLRRSPSFCARTGANREECLLERGSIHLFRWTACYPRKLPVGLKCASCVFSIARRFASSYPLRSLSTASIAFRAVKFAKNMIEPTSARVDELRVQSSICRADAPRTCLKNRNLNDRFSTRALACGGQIARPPTGSRTRGWASLQGSACLEARPAAVQPFSTRLAESSDRS